MNEIESKLSSIETRIAASAARTGRKPQEITLIAVTKKQPIERIKAYEAIKESRGESAIFGENYVQEAQKKRDALATGTKLHLIGPLQSNKTKKAVEIFDLIQSIHSVKIASEVSRASEHQGKVQDILLQVNISSDPNKSGFGVNDLAKELEVIQGFTNLSVKGLMTITELYSIPGEARKDFAELRRVRDTVFGMSASKMHLSMGMSDDFEFAIEEGATMVRIGTAIFGERE